MYTVVTNRSTTDMVLVLWKLQEQNRRLYAMFVALTKEFNTVSREGHWSLISTTNESSNNATTAASVPFLTSTEVTLLPVLKSLKSEDHQH